MRRFSKRHIVAGASGLQFSGSVDGIRIRPSLLAEGKLAVATARPPVTTDHGYWLMTRPGADTHALSVVRDWILGEAATTNRRQIQRDFASILSGPKTI